MDGRWGLGRKQAGKVSTRLDDERVTGGGHGVMTEFTKTKTWKLQVVRRGRYGKGHRCLERR